MIYSWLNCKQIKNTIKKIHKKKMKLQSLYFRFISHNEAPKLTFFLHQTNGCTTKLKQIGFYNHAITVLMHVVKLINKPPVIVNRLPAVCLIRISNIDS